ncbi:MULTISPECIES: 1,4-dihydroxy-2-naphthoate octaprenyltransferase [unclassified Halobacteriovorax]|uniref:1,4-dihydroxy-2-naphthoate octaprenyltransferase n=1 Tax=unclassified Halobacteriovorax TaxID=2639665 RepID=UPI00399C035E
MSQLVKGFIIAARPKTLPAGASPVILATAHAFFDQGEISWIIFVITLLCTLLLQISSNLINDYYDTQTGVDTQERLGPERVTNTGLIEPQTVKKFFIGTLALAFLLGIFLMNVGGMPIVILGLASIAGAYHYTGGPFPLSHYGMGELLALIFFGNIAVCGTYYLQTSTINDAVILLSLFPGLLSAAIMAINNARDIESDAIAKKMTLGVLLNRALKKQASSWLPLFFVAQAFFILCAHSYLVLNQGQSLAFMMVFLIITLIFLKTWTFLIKNGPSPAYNDSLARTGKYLFITSLIYSGILWLS